MATNKDDWGYTAAAYDETKRKFQNAKNIKDYKSAIGFGYNMIPLMAVADIATDAVNSVTGKERGSSTSNKSSVPTEKYYGPMKLSDYSDVYDDIYNSYYSASGGGYGGYSPQLIDPTETINAYNQAYESDKAYATNAYNQSRSDLLTSLKRFQEQNALDVENQKQNYLSNEASLDSARAEADRQNRISAASRGISGSGLQQLSQLQNLMAQGQDISNLAKGNQSAMDALRKALAEKEEDTDTNINNLTTNYNAELQKLASNLATNIANARYQADTYNANAINNARAQAASAAASASSNAALSASNLQTLLKNYEDQFKTSYNSLKNMDKTTWNTAKISGDKTYKDVYGKYSTANINKAITDAYNSSLNNVAELTDAYYVPESAYTTYKNNLNYYLNT